MAAQRWMDIPDKEGKLRVVIIGGGFAGLRLAQQLSHPAFQIVLLDKTNHHTFQPLLYQVATCGVEPSSISFPFRHIFDKREYFHIRMCTALKVDAEDNLLVTTIGDLEYDYLVIATGCDTNYFGNEDFASYTMPLKTTAEALYCRNRILSSLERALNTDDRQLRRQLMTFVIVGGGATGVELAGALAEMRKYVLPHDFPDLAVGDMRIIIVDGKDRLLYSFQPKSSREAEDYLKSRNVELMQKTRVKSYKNEILELSNGSIATSNVFWAAGVIGNTLEGFPKNAYGYGARIKVNRFNQVLDHKNIFAIGDAACMQSSDYPDGHPQVAQPALQQADNLARNLIHIARGEKEAVTPFKYYDRGSMATIGRNHAVVETAHYSFGGFLGWLVWLVIHLANIIGVKNRLFIFIDWCWSYFTHNSSLRLIIKPIRRHEPDADLKSKPK